MTSEVHCPRRLVILMYHAVVRSPLSVIDWCFLGEGDFRRQMEYVRDHFQVLPLSYALEGLEADTAAEPVVAVTFDDGFQNHFDVALPILEQLDVPATVFVPTAFVDSLDCLWFCKLNRALDQTRLSSLEYCGQLLDLSTAAAKARASAHVQRLLKSHPHPRLLTELDVVIRALGDDPDQRVTANSPYAPLTTDAIQQMVGSGLIEFGAHTHTHPILSLISGRYRQYEISHSVARIRELTGQSCAVFAYPNGRAQDYDQETITLLRQSGIRAAVTATWGVNDRTTSPMELMRFGIGADMTFGDFTAALRASRTNEPGQ